MVFALRAENIKIEINSETLTTCVTVAEKPTTKNRAATINSAQIRPSKKLFLFTRDQPSPSSRHAERRQSSNMIKPHNPQFSVTRHFEKPIHDLAVAPELGLYRTTAPAKNSAQHAHSGHSRKYCAKIVGTALDHQSSTFGHGADLTQSIAPPMPEKNIMLTPQKLECRNGYQESSTTRDFPYVLLEQADIIFDML